MPTGAPPPPGGVPCRPGALVLGFGRFPEREIAHVFLVVIVRGHPRARLDRASVETRESAVSRKLRNRVVDRPVVGTVRKTALHQLPNEGDHFRNVLGGLRI